MSKLLQAAAFLILLPVLACCAGGPNFHQADALPSAYLFDSKTPTPSAIRGVWTSIGYGWLLDIGDTHAELYDLTTNNCTRASALLKSYETYFHGYTLSDDRLGLSGIYTPYKYHFERATELPPSCALQQADPQSVFDAFAEVMGDHYAFFEERGIDWPALVETHARRISTDMSDDDLVAVLKDMLRPIDDGHVSLRTPDGRQFLPGRGRTMNSIVSLARERNAAPQALYEEWHADYFDQIESHLLDDGGIRLANNRIIFGKIGGDVGYINIRSMGGFVPDAGWSEEDFEDESAALELALDEAMRLFAGLDGVIVDVSDNSGSFHLFGELVTARFTDHVLEGNFRGPRSHPDLLQQERLIVPSSRQGFDGTVIVLASNLTVSAGESFLMSMRQIPSVHIAGEPTRGALSEVLTKTLPNGWELDLSNEVYLDESGISWEGKGIQPDIPIEVFSPENMFHGHVAAAHTLADRLRRQ